MVISGLTKRFRDVLAVDGLDLSVKRGDVFGFLGPNGAGKITTIRMMLSLQPAAALRAALAGVRDVVVLDRNHSPGAGGVLHQELRAALYGTPRAPRVHGLLAGVGGVNVPPQRIAAFVRAGRDGEPAGGSQWVR